MNETELKTEFAKRLLRNPTEPFDVALTLFPMDTSKASQVALEWPCDAEVIQLRDELMINQDPLALLPSKAELARSVWDKSEEQYTDIDSYIKLKSLYADIMGHKERPAQTTVNVQQNSNTLVLDSSNIENINEAERVYKEMTGF